MAYQLRDRKQKALYVDSNTSSSDSDNDGDYSSDTSMEEQSSSATIDSSNSQGEGQGDQMDNGSGASSPTQGAAKIEKRRPGRPPRNAAPAPVELGNVQIRERRTRRRKSRAPYSLRARSNSFGPNSLSYPGDKTTVLALLIDMEIVEENEEVRYYLGNNSRRQGLEGQVTRKGILCKCCQRVVTVSEFVAHAGGGDISKPYSRIVLAKNFFTLLGKQFFAWLKLFVENKWPFTNEYNSEGNASDESDDACLVCADGGDLICCEVCPLTFHTKCLDMEKVPGNTWVCPCCLCKHCKQAGLRTNNVMECQLCEMPYHIECRGDLATRTREGESNFCGNSCIKLSMRLNSLIGKKMSLEKGFSWSLLHHSIALAKKDQEATEFYDKVESNLKIVLAWFMMHQCFEPIVDRLTKIDILRSVIYNTSSKFTRINFKGFYTIVLEKNDHVIAAASLRFRGKELAEMPFVATQWSYRNKGMLKKLMTGIESALSYLDVENLVLPSAEDVEDMWIHKFGFKKIDKSLEKHMALSKMLMFPNSTRLMESIVPNLNQDQDDDERQEVAEENRSKIMLSFDLNLQPPQDDKELTWVIG